MTVLPVTQTNYIAEAGKWALSTAVSLTGFNAIYAVASFHGVVGSAIRNSLALSHYEKKLNKERLKPLPNAEKIACYQKIIDIIEFGQQIDKEDAKTYGLLLIPIAGPKLAFKKEELRSSPQTLLKPYLNQQSLYDDLQRNLSVITNEAKEKTTASDVALGGLREIAAVIVGLGPNLLISFMALHAEAYRAMQDARYRSTYKSRLKKLLKGRDYQTKLIYKRAIKILDHHLQQHKSAAKAYGLFAIPFIGPSIAYRYNKELLSAEVLLGPGMKDLGSDKLLEETFKLVNFPLKNRYPEQYYLNPEQEEKNLASKKLIQESMDSIKKVGQGKEILLRTEDGREIQGYWFSGEVFKPGHAEPVPVENAASTVVLYHGHDQIALDLLPWIAFYVENGMNVIAITIDGYGPNSNKYQDTLFESAIPSEKSIYLDAEAALNHVINNNKTPIGKVLVHGISTFGSAMAAEVATKHHCHLIIDQGMTSMEGLLISLANTFTHNKEDIVRKFVEKSFPTEGGSVNGFNNIKKLMETKAQSFLAIRTDRDELMGGIDIVAGIFNNDNFSEQLISAFTMKSTQDRPKSEMELQFRGQHGDPFTKSPEASKRMKIYLRQLKLVE